MGKKLNQATAAAITLVAGSLTGVGLAAADNGNIETRLPDVNEVNLTELESTENSVLVNSIKQIRQETESPYGPLGKFSNAPPVD